MSGLLGKNDLLAGALTEIYQVPAGTITAATINVCNRNASPCIINVALSDGPPTNADYIEYNLELCGSGVIERTGIILSDGQTINVRSDVANVSAQVWGWEEVI